jgi:NADH:ubiquinone oxidoreductase subunit H
MYFNFNVLIFVLILIILCFLGIFLVAYFTLQERIFLAAIQLRKGPNYVGFLGIAQPFADAIKLLLKEVIVPKKSNLIIFILAPLFMLGISLCIWSIFPITQNTFILLPKYTFLFPVLLSSLNALLVILIGWSSNSKYAFQGSIRSISQIVSYELSFTTILLSIILMYSSLEILSIIRCQINSWGIWNLLAFIIFFLTILGETNRTPFDLAEAESELVSGYNTEHGSILFTYMFLAEYTYIVIASNIFVILFFGGWFFIISAWYIYAIKLLIIL